MAFDPCEIAELFADLYDTQYMVAEITLQERSRREADSANERYRERALRRKIQVLCEDCGSNRPDDGKKRCAMCLLKRADYARAKLATKYGVAANARRCKCGAALITKRRDMCLSCMPPVIRRCGCGTELRKYQRKCSQCLIGKPQKTYKRYSDESLCIDCGQSGDGHRRCAPCRLKRTDYARAKLAAQLGAPAPRRCRCGVALVRDRDICHACAPPPVRRCACGGELARYQQHCLLCRQMLDAAKASRAIIYRQAKRAGRPTKFDTRNHHHG